MSSPEPNSIVHGVIVHSVIVALAAILTGGPLTGEDCNANGTEDSLDVLRGTSEDRDLNAIPDECEAAAAWVRLEREYELGAGPQPSRVRLADIDGDARPEIVVATSDRIIAFDARRRGMRRFEFLFPTPIAGFDLADLNADGDIDLAVGQPELGALVVISIDGEGREQTRSTIDVFEPMESTDSDHDGVLDGDLVAADFDGDGVSDLAAAWPLRFVGLLLSTRQEVLRPEFGQNNPLDLEVLDWDGDGDADLALRASGGVRVGRNQGAGDLLPPIDLVQDRRTAAMASLDIEGDGTEELIVFSTSSASLVEIYSDDGKGSSTLTTQRVDFVMRRPLAVGDLDRDGESDLILGGELHADGSGSLVAMRGTGDGSFLDPRTFRSGFGTSRVAIGDLDGDGDLDVVATNVDSGTLTVLSSVEATERDCGADVVRSPLDSDCNQNGIADHCDIASGFSQDCDRDGRPDECDWRPEFAMEAGIDLPLPGYPGAYTTADLDGDGDLDLAVGLADGERRLVLFFREGNRFRPASLTFDDQVDGWTSGRGMASGDMDGDGRVDLVLSGAREGLVVAFNRGGEGFEFGPPHKGLGAVLELADLDGDLDPDVIASFGIAFNVGGRLVWEPFAGRDRSAAATADFDGDGDLDLAEISFESAVISRNRGDGIFRPEQEVPLDFPTQHIVAADLDGDGDPDLAFGGFEAGLSIWLNDGGGHFEAKAPVDIGEESFASDIVAGDVDADGDLDLAVASGPMGLFPDPDIPFFFRITLYLNDGGAEFVEGSAYAASGESISLQLADLTADGRDDLLFLDQSTHAVAILAGEGSASFRGTGISRLGLSAVGLAAADLDADGDEDLIASDPWSPLVAIVENDGERFGLQKRAELRSESPASDALPMDLDGDGDLDLALVHPLSLTFWENMGLASFELRHEQTLGSTQNAALAADVNGDGTLEIVTANSLPINDVGNNVSVYFPQGLERPALVRNYFLPLNPECMTAADLDDDGDTDLAIGGEHLVLLLNDGLGAFIQVESLFQLSPRSGWADVASADLNGDGRLDLVGLSRKDGSLSVVLNRGETGFRDSPVELHVTGANASRLAPLDIDGDGDEDLAVFNGTSVSVNLNRGDGTFLEARRFRVGVDSGSLAAVDVNGDGLRDLVASTFDLGVRGLSVIENRTRPGRPGEAPPEGECSAIPFRRGDADASGVLDISDPIAILAHLFLGVASSCRDAADLDDSGTLDVTDPIVLLRFLFLSEGPIAAPGPACGLDLTEDALGCRRSSCH